MHHMHFACMLFHYKKKIVNIIIHPSRQNHQWHSFLKIFIEYLLYVKHILGPKGMGGEGKKTTQKVNF